VVEDIVEAYLALRARPDELFIDTVKRPGRELSGSVSMPLVKNGKI